MNNKNIITIDQKFAKYNLPQYLEKKDKVRDIVKYGADNQFPNYLISLIAKSPRHASILKKKAMLIGGRGFITTNLKPETMMFLANSRNDEDLETILAAISYDFELFGGFYLNLVWSKDRQSIAEINYIAPDKVRIQPLESDNNDPLKVEGYWVSDDWTKLKDVANTPVLYSGFSTINRKEASQILYIKNHRAGTEYYAQPDYLPAIYWMELEWKISEFHLASVVNGFSPAFHINWPIGSNASDEERDELASMLKANFAGAINASESFISFAENEVKPTITPIPVSQSDQRFIQLDSLIEKGIMHSHRVNHPELFGLDGGEKESKLGSGSSAGERVQAMMEFELEYVVPQQQIIEKVLNRIARINGITDKIMINRYSDSYKKVGGDTVTDVISIISNQDISPEQKYHLLVSLNYTHDLASKLSGYEEGNNQKVIVKQPKPNSVTGTQSNPDTKPIK